jgi:hypothetical protein
MVGDQRQGRLRFAHVLRKQEENIAAGQDDEQT